MSTAIKPAKKKNPCEECREHKRKCTCEQPCERCTALGLNCVYVVVNTPRDQEYLMLTRNIEAQVELKVIEEQINDMETELKQLRKGQSGYDPSNIQSYPSPTSDIDAREDHKKTMQVYSEDTTQSTQLIRMENNDPARNPQQLMDETLHGIGAQLYQIEDNSSNKENEWALTITKKGLRIETNIKNMADLIAQVKVMNFQLGNVDKPPLYSHLVSEPINPTLMIKFGEKAWIKILEGNKKALHRCVVFMKDQALPDVNRIQLARPDVSTAMTVQLLQIYFSCQHLRQMAIHRKTFLDMFFKPNDVKAPVYALCAAIVTMRCKHVLQVVPYESQLIYGEYYFNKARQLYSEQFDEISLETYCTLIFMTMYKATILRPDEGDNYLNLANRMGEELLPLYSRPASPSPGSKQGDDVGLRTFTLSGEAEMFKRLLRTCKQLAFRLFLLKQPSHLGPPPKHFQGHGPGPHRMSHRMKGDPADRYPHHQGVHPRSLLLSCCLDETPIELRYIQQSKYMALHRETIHTVMASVFPHIHDTLSSTFVIATITSFDQSMRNWYYQTLPQELRIALPLFDDTISDTTLIEAVSFDRIRDSVPLTLLITFYTEFIVVMKKLLPRIPQYDDSHLSFGVMSQETDEERQKRKEKKKQKRRKVFRHLINEYNLNMTEEQLHEFYHQQFDLPHDFQIEAQDKCTRAANLAVRLLEQLTNSSFSCHFDLPTLMCTWDMHLRNSRLGHARIDQPDGIVDPKVTRQARHHLVRCLAIMRRGFLYNTAERELWKHYQLMEQDLLRELSLDPAFKVSSGPEPEFHIGHSVNTFAT
ncbi:hypothetical protein K450DRAFT_228920 [Umbelopsis ramanniana AG]|uniref:Zn(2)-C6 fungal-type domain-containing protein n=1 Tax=Umbelopsis ramanniana AG TaxID=1314678 RepID=A0AAD5EE79_UMBRA|nr:uncharacterized protein K450DRAFT_228920 [Umbelopsis ramanniana AG]KAI8582083.1 hypothetical protein K450DRAFT_228920 [Umbelopsis ramanniana AG]